MKVKNAGQTDLEKCDLMLDPRSGLEFAIDGPYPSPLGNFKRHKTLVFIAAGVGITPFISILNEIR